MYNVSDEYKNLILADSTQQALNIYIDGTRVDDKYVLGLNFSHVLFEDDEFCFGSTPAKTAELKIHINALPDTYNRIYIETGIDNGSLSELIPMGYFNVDKIEREDSYTVKLTLIDDMSKFEFNYDGSVLDYPTTMLTILQDICDTVGIELGTTSFINSDKTVAVYDNTVTARTYIGYIAEQAGGFAIIGRDGKLYIKTIGEDTDELELKKFADYTWGEQFQLSRVAYEDGVQDFKVGDETYNTIWINSDNMYIVDEEQIQNIYNNYSNFNCYSFSGTSIIDPAWDIGDIIIIDGKKIIYQGDIEYKGKFKASIESEIQAKSKEETTVTKVSDKTLLRRVQSTIDQDEALIKMLTEEITEYSSQLSELTLNLDSISTKVESITDFTRETTQITNLYLSNEDVPSGEGYIVDFIIYGGDNFTSNIITICVSEYPRGYGASNYLVTENEDYLTTENGYYFLLGEGTYYTALVKLILDDVLRSMTVDNEVIYDTLEILQDGTIQITRRIGVDNEGNLYQLAEEVITVLNEKVILPTYEEGTYYYIKELDAITYYANYITINEFSDLFLLKDELGTYITQNAESVQIAWNQISQYIKFEALDDVATLNIYNEDDNLLMSLSQDGQTFYNENGNTIGTIGIIREDEQDILAFSLPIESGNTEDASAKMAWGVEYNGNFLPLLYMNGYYAEEDSEYGGYLYAAGSFEAYTMTAELAYIVPYGSSVEFLDNAGSDFGDISYSYTDEAIYIDAPLVIDSVKAIYGTASGTIFPDLSSGGITVENGLITSWNMGSYWSGTVTYGSLTLTFVDGLLTNVS